MSNNLDTPKVGNEGTSPHEAHESPDRSDRDEEEGNGTASWANGHEDANRTDDQNPSFSPRVNLSFSLNRTSFSLLDESNHRCKDSRDFRFLENDDDLDSPSVIVTLGRG